MQGYENADKFDPDRFSAERGEDIKYAHNFLVFGYGPHYCVGKEVSGAAYSSITWVLSRRGGRVQANQLDDEEVGSTLQQR